MGSTTGIDNEYRKYKLRFTTVPLLWFKDAYDQGGGYEICDVCDWEDDPVQFGEPDYAGGANKISLNQARKEWLAKIS